MYLGCKIYPTIIVFIPRKVIILYCTFYTDRDSQTANHPFTFINYTNGLTDSYKSGTYNINNAVFVFIRLNIQLI